MPDKPDLQKQEEATNNHYTILERLRLGVCEVVDIRNLHEILFVGIREDCEEWIKDPSSRLADKRASAKKRRQRDNEA